MDQYDKGVCGMNLEPLYAEEARKNRGGDRKSQEYKQSTGSNEHIDSDEELRRARTKAAKRVGLSPTTYHRVKTILTKAPEKVYQPTFDSYVKDRHLTT